LSTHFEARFGKQWSDDLRMRALAGGAFRYLVKGVTPQEIAQSVREAARTAVA